MSYGERNYDQPREMYKTTCSECGKECEVPFKPTEGRPVYCKDCYAKHRPPRRQGGGGGGGHRHRREDY
ncbi:MAG: hypothetical protein JW834_04715 [Candidatus Diapherotrites archaeon]|nr:hypothetical protein [Candidatus Diapherotrites archaeon]